MPLRVTHEIYSPTFLPLVNSFSNGWDVRYETVKEALNKNSTTERRFAILIPIKNFFSQAIPQAIRPFVGKKKLHLFRELSAF